jgi:hypothetical protein
VGCWKDYFKLFQAMWKILLFWDYLKIRKGICLMSKRVLFGLIGSTLLIIFSISMCVYIYYYSTTNRMGVVGDGKFHFRSTLTFIFTFISGILSLTAFIIRAYQDKRGRDED